MLRAGSPPPPPPQLRRRRQRISFSFRPLLLLFAAAVSALIVLLRLSPPSDIFFIKKSTLVDPYVDMATLVGPADGRDLINADVANQLGHRNIPPVDDGDLETQVGPSDALTTGGDKVESGVEDNEGFAESMGPAAAPGGGGRRRCATVEDMGSVFNNGSETERESLRVRELIRQHFELNGKRIPPKGRQRWMFICSIDLPGADRVGQLPPHQFCRQGFVMGKASEAGFGNEMYKLLTGAALSVILNRSLIIGQTRGSYPFGEYISYSNVSFTIREIKHLWRKNDCTSRYGRKLVVRVDNFEQPSETNVLCSDWRLWKQPVIWFQGTTDAVAIQFFLKNVHPGMRTSASMLLGKLKSIQSRPNMFGELMRVLISPTKEVKEAVDWVLKGIDPDISLHMRMLTNRPVRAMQAAVSCIKRALASYQWEAAKPRVVLISDTPSLIKDIMPSLAQFVEVIHFDYRRFEGNISGESLSKKHEDFRAKDWGPAPRWVAFVDFFLASRAKHAIVAGAHRRVGTTYAQLIAALAAANQHGKSLNSSDFSFFSSFHSNLLVDGLKSQVGWGHIWNRFAGPLSCPNQPHQCALTPLLPPGWWDGEWQSPISRDKRRLQSYGIQLTDRGEVIKGSLESYCRSRKDRVKTIQVFSQCTSNIKCF